VLFGARASGQTDESVVVTCIQRIYYITLPPPLK
jgi:hypothetical protein